MRAIVVTWALTCDLPVSLSGRTGGPSTTTVELRGERLMLLESPNQRPCLVLEDGGKDARLIIADGHLADAVLRRVLERLGYGEAP